MTYAGIGNTSDKPLVSNPPVGPGYPGEIVPTTSKNLQGKDIVTYYKFTIDGWKKVSNEEAGTAQALAANLSRLQKVKEEAIDFSSTKSLRYPNKDINENGDYVLFKFKKYQAPFGNRKKVDVIDGNGKVYDYNQSNEYVPAGEDYKTIIMYMPEDISTGFKANWGGKAFSNIGAGLLVGLGAGDAGSKLKSLGESASSQFDALLPKLGSAAIQKAITKITGDSISNNDIFGSISGAVLNPNVELLFDSIDMRNFNLKFKLVPRNSEESGIINEICKIFKMCTLPGRNPGKVFGFENRGTANDFIAVPNLCQVSFMRGPTEHQALPRYKMCAITNVDVNYTPDGTYATYSDTDNPGQPVAIELSIGFQETKLVFSEEIANNSVR